MLIASKPPYKETVFGKQEACLGWRDRETKLAGSCFFSPCHWYLTTFFFPSLLLLVSLLSNIWTFIQFLAYMHNLHCPWRGRGKRTAVRLQKPSPVQKPQTGPGERRWSPVWFAFAALIPRQTFTNGGGGERGWRWVKGEKEVSTGVTSSQGSHILKKTFRRLFPSFSLSLSQTHLVSPPAPNCGNSTASLWSRVFIWGMLCQVSGRSSYQGD